MICHACGTDDVAGSTCRECGSPLGRVCPSCSFENVAESRYCGGCGKALQEAQAEDSLGELRQITCLFIDLVGSTALSQRLDPEDLRDLLAAYQVVCADAVEVHGGHIAQFLGDGVVVYFGYPRSHEDDAPRAVRCALDILEEIEHLNDTRDEGSRLAIRLGAHTGRVLVGPVGAGDRSDRIALGDTPNIAARLEGEADVGTVAISDATWQLLRGGFTGRNAGDRILKGVKQPMPVWVVEGRARVLDRFDLAAELSPLVGRDDELAKLTSIVDESFDTGNCRFVLIRGEAGVGKSRLVHALQESYNSDHVTTLLTRSTPAMAKMPFGPIRELLRARLGLEHATDPIAEVEALLDRRGLKSDAEIANLATVLGITVPERVVPSGDTPGRQRTRTMELLIELLARAAAESPTLLIIEDVHWSDASTLEWIDRLIAATPNVAMTVVFAARPALEAVWLADTRVEIVDLGRLDTEAIASLAGSVALNKALPRAVLREITERSEGVPLFVEELTRFALESGRLAERSSTWETVGSTVQGFIPTSVDSSLTARVDSIGGSRGTAQLAAVIGREFDVPFLTRVSTRPVETVEVDIKSMIKAGLVQYVDGDPDRVMFKHALIRDAAYNTLLRTARRTYHRRIADGLAAQRGDVSADALAYHLHQAGDFASATPQWLAAAKEDLTTSSFFEAAGHFALAIECVQALEPTVEAKTQELELQSQIWPLWATTEGWGSNNVEAACQRGIALATELERYDLLYVPLWGLWSVYLLRGEMSQALETAHRVREVADASGMAMLRQTGEHAVAYIHLYRGELDEALVAAERGLELYEFEQEREIAATFQLSSMVCLLGMRSDIRYLQGWIDGADADLVALDRLARDLGHPPSLVAGIAFALHRGVLRFPAYGRFHRFVPVLDELLEITAGEGSLLWEALAELYRVAAESRTAEELEGRISRAWEMYSQTGSGLLEVNIRIMWAEAHFALGDSEGASRELNLAEKAQQEREEALLAPDIWRLRGRIAAASGDMDEAQTAYDKALAMADSQGAVMLRLRTLVDRFDDADESLQRDLVDEIESALTSIRGGDGEPEVVKAQNILSGQRT